MANILAYDTQPGVGRLLTVLFEKLSHTITQAKDIPDACEKVRTKPYDLVVVGIKPTESEIVRPLLDYMERKKPEIPVVLYSTGVLGEEWSSLYAHAHVEKTPATKGDTLVEAVDKLLK